MTLSVDGVVWPVSMGRPVPGIRQLWFGSALLMAHFICGGVGSTWGEPLELGVGYLSSFPEFTYWMAFIFVTFAEFKKDPIEGG